MAAEPEFRGADASTIWRQAVAGFHSTILQSDSGPQVADAAMLTRWTRENDPVGVSQWA
jgi:hypothetical protein